MNLPPCPRLRFVFAESFGTGADRIAMLTRWCEETPDARLIVIDTLGKFRSASDGRRNIYEVDVEALSAIKAVADRFQIAILLVHHVRKGAAADIFETVSGSFGLTGTTDTNMVLSRKHGPESNDGTLHVTGRDLIGDREWALRFKDGTWVWIGDAGQVAYSKTRQEVIAAIRGAGVPLGPTQIAEAIGSKRTTIAKTLGRMLQDREVHWEEGGKYGVNDEDRGEPKF